MAKNSESRFWAIKVYAVALLTLTGYMSAIALRNYTMVNFGIVMAVCLSAGLLAGVVLSPLVAKLTGKRLVSLNVAVGAVIAAGVAAGLFFILNFAFADSSTNHREQAVIERKYRETHYRSKRVGRNRYVRGEPYYEYYFDVCYSNGSTKAMPVNFDRYRRLDAGDTIDVDISRGLFGFAVVKR